MRHDRLPPPTASHAELLHCAPLSLSPPPQIGGDLGGWLFACPSPVPAAATPTDALETDVHVHTQRDLLADLPLDWELASILAKAEPQQHTSPLKTDPPHLPPPVPQSLCPESPCSVAFPEMSLQRLQPLLPAQICSSHCDICLDVLCGDLALAGESGDANCLLRMTGGDLGEAETGNSVKHDLSPSSSASQPTEQPWNAVFAFESGEGSVGDVGGKERLRKRQRAYERKYRKKKRTTFKLMRREWLHLEMALFALQTQHAEAVSSLPVDAAARDKLAQLCREEKALVRSLVLQRTAARWVEFFQIQLEGEEQESVPVLPTSSSEWGTLVETAAGGLSVCVPFLPPRFRFSW